MKDWDEKLREIEKKYTLYHLDKRMRFFHLWRIGIEGQGVTVAVLDTGVDPVYQIKNNISINKDFTNENNPKDREKKHGTITATLINNITPKAKIANFKVIPQKGRLKRETVRKAIEHCIDEYPNYGIINLSLWFSPKKCPDNCILCSIVDEAIKKGILVVISAGNRSRPQSDCPGTVKDAITVGTTWSKEEWDYWEHIPWWKKPFSSFPSRYGTSYSAANISGCFALLMSAFPEKSIKEIINGFKKSIDPRSAVPQMNCARAFRVLLGNRPIPPEIVSVTLDDYSRANGIIYDSSLNRTTQENPSPLLISALETTFEIIDFYLIQKRKFGEAIKELEKMRKHLIPGAMPSYEKRNEELVAYCKQNMVL